MQAKYYPMLTFNQLEIQDFYMVTFPNYVKCDQLALTWVPLATTVEAVYSQPYKRNW